MNILHFINLSVVGGIERQFQRFICHIAENKNIYANYKHSVLVYNHSIHNNLSLDIKKKCERLHVFKQIFPDLLFPSLIRPARCVKIFKKNQYDALIVTSMLRNNIQKKTISLFPGVKIFYDKGWSTSSDLTEDMSIFDGFMANSYSTKQTLIKKFHLPSEKIQILHNSYPEDFENIDLGQARFMIRKSLNIGSSDKLVLGLGRFKAFKGFTMLIEAFRYIKDKEKDSKIKLLLVGSGKQESLLRQLISDYQLKDRIILTGHTCHPGQYYACSDLFVLPSCREPFGIVLLEAGITKTPIIANDLDGIRDTVRDKSLGYLITPEKSPTDFSYLKPEDIPKLVYYPQNDQLAPPLFPNPQKLAESIRYALANHHESMEKAEKLYKLVKKEFSIKQYTDNLHSIVASFQTCL